MSDLAVRRAVDVFANWLNDNKTELHGERGRWLFALLCALETPLDADTAAALVRILRVCKRSGDEQHALFVTLIEQYFRQRHV